MTALARDTTCSNADDQAATLVKQALIRSVAQDGIVTPKHEAQVHKAIDLLRATRGDPALLSRFEAMSCTLAQMRLYLHQGRVNAYASALLRLRSAANAI